VRAPTHVWRTDDGRLVPDGDRDAAILEYATGDEMTVVPEWLAEPEPEESADEGDETDAPKRRTTRPADKARKPAADKGE
jgi:hypothetical protein